MQNYIYHYCHRKYVITMLKKRKNVFLKKDKLVLLACDQGLEHGPDDFNEKNIDPKFIVDIATYGKYDGLILHHGLAEKYYNGKVPLILKINGKTSFSKDDPYSPIVFSPREAYKLGASAIGLTIYVGSKHEGRCFQDAHRVIREARKYGLAVIGWMYPRGQYVKDPDNYKTIAYAARVGLELGFDYVKLREPKQLKELPWITKCAGKTKVLMAGGAKMQNNKLVEYLKFARESGVTGLAIGRNVWQDPNPLEITQTIKDNFLL